MIVRGNRIYFRELNSNDATEEYSSWLRDSEVNTFLASNPCSREELRQYIEQKQKDKNCLFWGIFLNEADTHIGNLKLEPVNFEEKKAVMGILIGKKECWNKSLGTEAISLAVDYCFTELELEEITLGVVKEHLAAIKAYEKAGFTKQKINEKGIAIRGKWYDQLIMIKKKEEKKIF